MTRRIPLLAVACYVAGYGIGSALSWWAWVSVSGEHVYRLTWRNQ